MPEASRERPRESQDHRVSRAKYYDEKAIAKLSVRHKMSVIIVGG